MSPADRDHGPRFALADTAKPPEVAIPSDLVVERLHLFGDDVERGAPGLDMTDG